jgi:AraC family transcriptional regulator of adaptative response / DNA-3-methyladenine glycosylase II
MAALPHWGRAGPDRSVTRRLRLELAFRPPLEVSNLFGHLAATAVPGVEEWRDGWFRAAVRLRHGSAILAAAPPHHGVVPATALLADDRDEAQAVRRLRRLLDLDADPGAVAAVLGRDPALRPLIEAAPGRRVPGSGDPGAMTLRAVLGQQVSTAAARTHAARLVQAFGEPVDDPDGGLTALFPKPAVLAAAGTALDAAARMPASRRRTLVALAGALATGTVDVTGSAAAVRAALAALPGVGPWTVDTIAMRAAGDGDAFPATDLGVRLAAARLGLPDRPRDLTRRAESWAPFRSYAVQYLWATGEHPVNTLPGT